MGQNHGVRLMTIDNNNRLYRLFVSILLIFVLSNIGMGNILAGKAGSFLRMDLGADRVGIGGAGVALTSSSTNWFYNPSAISVQGSRQAVLSYRYMSLDRSLMYVGFSAPIQPSAGLAIGVLRAGIDNIDGRDSNGEKFDELSYSDNLIHGSFSLHPHPRIALGLSIKWMINSIPDILEDDKNLYAYGLGVDLGFRFQVHSRLSFGLLISDLDGKHSWDTSEIWGEDGMKVDRIPVQVRIGMSWIPFDGLLTVLDLVSYTQLIDEPEAFRPKAGIEWTKIFTLSREFILRGGYNGKAPSFGIGLRMELLEITARMDYAFYLEPISPSGSHLITWTFEL